MDTKLLNDISKFLSYVLRHEPQAIGLELDSEGWAETVSSQRLCDASKEMSARPMERQG